MKEEKHHMLRPLKKLIQLGIVHERQMLIGLFIFSLGLRVGAVIYLGVPYPVYEDLMEPGQIAENLIRGAGYTFDFYGYRSEAPLQAFIPPHYPLLVYSVLRWTSEPALALGLVQAFIGSLMPILMYLLVRGFADHSAALLSAWLTAIYPVFVIQTARPLPTTLVGFLITAVMTTTVLVRRGGYGRSLALGLALGLAALARTTMLGLIPIVILWLWLNRWNVSRLWRKLGIALLVTALVISPWLIRNYLVFGEWVFSTNAGITFWNGNNPFTTGSGWDVYIERLRLYSGHPFPDYPADGIVTPRPYPLPNELETQVGELDELELDRQLLQAGIAFIQTQPRLWLNVTAQKLVSFWWFRPNIGMVRYLYNPEWLLPYKLVYVPLLALAVIGVILSLKQWRMYSLFYACFAYFSCAYVAFNVVSRYRFEIEQFLLLFASLALTQGIARSGESPSEESEDKWESFARKDAEFYVCTALDPGDFFPSGERTIANILHQYGSFLDDYGSALEIGCGVGRLAIPLARVFRHVTAVDISPTMLDKLAANCSQLGLKNVEACTPSGDWIRESWHDFAISLLVFQHIEDEAIIQGYIIGMYRCLKPGGIALLQFDTRARTVAYRLRNLIPDALLPRTQRRGIRRIRRSREELLALFSKVGFRLLANDGKQSESEVFVLRKG